MFVEIGDWKIVIPDLSDIFFVIVDEIVIEMFLEMFFQLFDHYNQRFAFSLRDVLFSPGTYNITLKGCDRPFE